MNDEDRTDALAAAERIGLDLPEPCLPGVIDNRRLLATHRALLERFFAEDPGA